MTSEEIYNYIKVNDEIITSGQPTADQLASLAAEGFATVINLAAFEPAHSLADEAELVCSHGMRYDHIPVDWSEPKASDFAAFERTMLQLPAGKTLIHCVANFRVTAFYSLYAQKHLGWSPAQADEFRAAIWKGSEYPIWRKFIGRIEALLAQEAQLQQDPTLRRFAVTRQELAADPYRPLYHFVSPESNLNDPNGLCCWQGQWHLFYQAYPPANPRPHWGHVVSDDLIHWRDLPYALTPGPEEACWSGSTLVEDERVIAMYHGHELGNMVAVASDPLLLDWQKVTGTTVIPNPRPIWTRTTGDEQMAGVGGSPVPAGAINFVYDPCIWKKDGFYYSTSGGTLPHGPSGRRTRAQFLFRSRDLATWEYLHPFVEGDIYGLAGDDGGCPYFWPIGDRHILLHFSHMSGAHYLLGDYDTARDKFVVTHGGRFTFGPWYPGGVHAPTATPDGKRSVIALFNINVAKPTPGWNQIMSLPRRLTLAGKDELVQAPAGDIESLRYDHRQVAAQVLPANREVVLEGVQGKAIEIAAEIDLGNAQMFELNVLRAPGKEEFTRIAFYKQRGYVDWDRSDGWARFNESRDSLIVIDTSYASALPDVESRAPESAPVYLAPGETLKLRVFIDRSVVEVFVNERQCLAVRVYPGREDSTGVSLRAQGAEAVLCGLDIWQMKSIYA